MNTKSVLPSRIREVPEGQLTEAQQRGIEAVLGGRGKLPTPYKVWLHSPELMLRLERLGTFLVTQSSLKPREQELALLLVAAHWHGQYVFDAHAKAARSLGVDDSVIGTIASGHIPQLADRREAVICELVASAIEPEPANDELFDRAINLLGDSGIADLLAFVGYYSAVAIAMKLFRVSPRL